MTADEIDTGLLKLWRLNICQLLVQVHDSILIQYPEELEDVILPQAIAVLKTKLVLEKGREFIVPVDAKVGWNWVTTRKTILMDCRSGRVGTAASGQNPLGD